MKRVHNFFLLTPFLFTFFLLTSCGSSNSSSASDSPAKYIENKGSDTIVNLALAWAEQYQGDHPDVRISVTGGGSGTGIAALVNGTVDIANASRKIKDEETVEAQSNGVEPVEHIIARDAIAVIVNPNNPVSELTLQQISDIYSGKYVNWTEVGGEDRPIVRLSRETNSGTHVYFLETVLRLGNKENKTLFSMDTLLLPSSEGIISEVRDNPNAIGYDGLGYVPDDLKMVAIAKKQGGAYVLPSIETVNDKSYAIARDLYMYTNGEPTGIVKEYLDWILSDEAQVIVAELGFVPVLK
jgi:phosphate transport system substrate-binding protein